MTIEYRLTLRVKSRSLDSVCQTLLKILGPKEILIHAFEIPDQNPVQPDIIPKESTPIPREMWKEPTPIVTQDKNPNSQEQQILKYFFENPGRVIRKQEFNILAKSKNWRFNSVMTAVSKLARTHNIIHKGRGQGYVYEPGH